MRDLSVYMAPTKVSWVAWLARAELRRSINNRHSAPSAIVTGNASLLTWNSNVSVREDLIDLCDKQRGHIGVEFTGDTAGTASSFREAKQADILITTVGRSWLAAAPPCLTCGVSSL